jgi:DNA-binding protein HU-beta
MNKAELVNAITTEIDVSKASAGRVLDAVFGRIADYLAVGEDVTIHGFGAFHVKDREARTGRNPATGQTIQIPASKAVVFKPAKALKDLVN